MCEFWLEAAKVLLTPIVVAILGVLLLRRVEGIKSEVAKQSDFNKKWAEQFFECCQEFMRALERELALLNALATLENPNDELGTKLKKEISQLHPTLSELELRIRRSVAFAPLTGGAATKAADECIKLTGALTASMKGNFDEIINKMNEFNVASRKVHEEMLGLSGKRA